MKNFRRVLLYVLLAVMTGSLVYQCVERQKSEYDTSVSVMVWFFALVGVLIWSAICLKIEPLLTRIALVLATLTLSAIGLWTFLAVTSQ